MKKMILKEIENNRIKKTINLSKYINDLDYSSNYQFKISSKIINNIPITVLPQKDFILVENLTNSTIGYSLTEKEFEMILSQVLDYIKNYSIEELTQEVIYKFILKEINQYLI